MKNLLAKRKKVKKVDTASTAGVNVSKNLTVSKKKLSYPCDKCPKKLSRRILLQRHLWLHKADRPFKCQEVNCSSSYITAKQLKSHTQVVHLGEGLKCEFCPKRFPSKSHLKDHHLSHTGERPFSCPHCPFRAQRKAQLQLHTIYRHSTVRPFKCPLCPIATKTKGTLDRHIIGTHTYERAYKCPHHATCGYTAHSANLIRMHLQNIHSDLRPFACTLCPFRSKTRSNLTGHMVIHSNEKPFECPHDCGWRASRKYLVRRHVNAVHPEKVGGGDGRKFQCPFCPYRGRTSSQRNEHVRCHTGEKPYKCPKCPFAFASGGNLSAHMIKHGGERKIVCLDPNCGHKFLFARDMRVHYQRRHLKQPLPGKLSCPFENCGHRTVNQSALQIHIRHVHTEERPFVCSLCQYSAKSRQHLVVHLTQTKVHTKNEILENYPDHKKDEKAFKEHVIKTLDHREKFRKEKIKCTVCEHESSRRGDMTRHMRTHDNKNDDEKRFPCNLCPHVAKMKRHLKKHCDSMHSKHNKFPCTKGGESWCTFIFKSKKTLQKHLNTAHGGGMTQITKISEEKVKSSHQKFEHNLPPVVTPLEVITRKHECPEDWCKFWTRDLKKLALHLNHFHQLPKVVIHWSFFPGQKP